MLAIRNSSLFRTGFLFANRACKYRCNQVHKSNIHQCMPLYEKREVLNCHSKEYMYEDGRTTAHSKEYMYEDGNIKAVSKDTSKTTSLRQPFTRLTGRYQLMYTCKKCNTRNTVVISKTAYHHGAVVASCSGCKANHLIADNLKWFGDKEKNIEDIMKEKGESVTKITEHDLFLEILPADAPDPVPRDEVKKLPPLTI